MKIHKIPQGISCPLFYNEATHYFKKSHKVKGIPLFITRLSKKKWLYNLPSHSTTTWNTIAKLFLGKYFMEARVSNLLHEILGSKQAKWEPLHTYWCHFKKLCVWCPQHAIIDYQIYLCVLQMTDSQIRNNYKHF